MLPRGECYRVGWGMGQSLTERYEDRIAGVLSCYDRVVITGTVPVYWLRVFPALGFGRKPRKCGVLRWMAAPSDQTGQDRLFDRARVNFVQHT